jgi:hypothetical protein
VTVTALSQDAHTTGGPATPREGNPSSPRDCYPHKQHTPTFRRGMPHQRCSPGLLHMKNQPVPTSKNKRCRPTAMEDVLLHHFRHSHHQVGRGGSTKTCTYPCSYPCGIMLRFWSSTERKKIYASGDFYQYHEYGNLEKTSASSLIAVRRHLPAAS